MKYNKLNNSPTKSSFLCRFNGKSEFRDQLDVRVIDEQAYAKVEFRSTSETTGENLLNKLKLPLSTLSIDDQVSQVYCRKEDKVLNSFNHADHVTCHVFVLLLTILSTSLQYFEKCMLHWNVWTVRLAHRQQFLLASTFEHSFGMGLVFVRSSCDKTVLSHDDNKFCIGKKRRKSAKEPFNEQ